MLEAKADSLGLGVTEYIRYALIASLQPTTSTLIAKSSAEPPVQPATLQTKKEILPFAKDEKQEVKDKFWGEMEDIIKRTPTGIARHKDIERMDDIQVMYGWGRIDREHLKDDNKKELPTLQAVCANCRKQERLKMCLFCQSCHDSICLGE
jgi:hypothetical protein